MKLRRSLGKLHAAWYAASEELVGGRVETCELVNKFLVVIALGVPTYQTLDLSRP